jgi:carbon-monoxide dehydrogenase medium subunit
MRDFEFQRAGSVAEAVAALRRGGEAKCLAGGQSLIPLLKLELAQPERVVSLAGVQALRGVRVEKGRLVVGALATHAELETSEAVRRALPALAELAGGIGDPQVRQRGTLGGSLAHADPAADHPAAVLGLGATVHTDRREIAADDFFRGLYETALAPDELVTAVRYPIPEAAAWEKFPQPASRFALVGVFVARAGGRVRVAVTGAASRVFRWSEAERALEGRFAAEALQGLEVPPEGLLANADAGADYRAHLIGVLSRRAVARCA